MFCIYCGSTNPSNAAFCSACGKAMPSHASAAEPQESGSQSGAQAPLRAPVQPQGEVAHQVPQSVSQPQPAPSAAGKSKAALWVFVGVAAGLIIAMLAISSQRQSRGSSENDSSSVAAESVPSAAAPAVEMPIAPAPAPESAPPVESAPAQAPPAPAAAPQNPIVGQWKTTTLIGDTVLTFGADGRYSIKSALVGENGVYVFSSGDGTLRLQQDAIFSHDVVIWNCQLSGDSLSVVDPEGAGHVYTRVQ